MLLTEKITSKAAWEAYPLHSRYQANALALRRDCGEYGYGPTPFWVQRELARMDSLYESTCLTNWVNQRYAVFAHVSMQDRKLVAYTPSAADGEVDRQIKIAPGRLLARLCPVLSDEFIRTNVETHYAELIDPSEIEFLSGKAIAEAYDNCASGTAACMSDKTWSDFHPAEAYDMPNIRMAVLRNSEGQITRRCMVYEPSETDKRYIRVYPNDAKPFAKALEKLGYKCGTWVGAEFKVLKRAHGDYRIPYLDSNGGLAGEGSYVAMIDGRIYSVSSKQKATLGSIYSGSTASTPGSTASVHLADLDGSKLMQTCAMSGRTVNTLLSNEQFTTVWHEGQAVKALKSEVPEGYTIVYTTNHASLLARPEDTVNVSGYGAVLNDEASLRYVGAVKLDKGYYPDESGYTAVSQTTHDGKYIRKADAVSVIKGDDVLIYHESEITKSFTRLTRSDILLAPGEKVLRTANGSKVHPKVHDLCTLWTGELSFSRGKKGVSVLGITYWHDGTHPGDDWFEDELSKLTLVGLLNRWRRSVASSYIEIPGAGGWYIGNLRRDIDAGLVTWEALAQGIKARTGTYDKLVARVMLNAIADMNAIDYNLESAK